MNLDQDKKTKKLLDFALKAEGEDLRYILDQFLQLDQGTRFYLAHHLEKARIQPQWVKGFSPEEIEETRELLDTLDAADIDTDHIATQIALIDYVATAKGVLASEMISGLGEELMLMSDAERATPEKFLNAACNVSEKINIKARVEEVRFFMKYFDVTAPTRVKASLDEVLKKAPSTLQVGIAAALEKKLFPHAEAFADDLSDMRDLALALKQTRKTGIDGVEFLYQQDNLEGTNYLMKVQSYMHCVDFILALKADQAAPDVQRFRAECSKFSAEALTLPENQLTAMCNTFDISLLRQEENRKHAEQKQLDDAASQLIRLKTTLPKSALKSRKPQA